MKFNEAMIAGLEWQQRVPLQTASGQFRVEITWALDKYRISVYRRVQEPEKFVTLRHAFYRRTAVKTANRLLRVFNRY